MPDGLERYCPGCNQEPELCRCGPRYPRNCSWPHEVGTIYVYDRESFEKYSSGEYKPPVRCLCGEEIKYEDALTFVLIEQGDMTGEMIVQVPIPLTHVTLDLSDKVGVDG